LTLVKGAGFVAGIMALNPLKPSYKGTLMIPRVVNFAAFMAATVSMAKAQSLPPVPVLTESPWNGDWVLSQTRNTAEAKAGAAEGYRFLLQPDGRIRWEIPSLHEVVEAGSMDRPCLFGASIQPP
jgi:hypothetical protein